MNDGSWVSNNDDLSRRTNRTNCGFGVRVYQEVCNRAVSDSEQLSTYRVHMYVVKSTQEYVVGNSDIAPCMFTRLGRM